MTKLEQATVKDSLTVEMNVQKALLLAEEALLSYEDITTKQWNEAIAAIRAVKESLTTQSPDQFADGGKVINADRELLELAAKAACYEVYWHHANQCYMIVEGSSERKWKPLSNGHDSLQLAAKLLMNVEINKASVIVCLPPLESGFTPPPIFEYPVSDYDEDFNVNYFRHYEATCLAILRAAAEIGKELP